MEKGFKKEVIQNGKGKKKVNRGTSRKVKKKGKKKKEVNRVDKGKRGMTFYSFFTCFTCFLPFSYLFSTFFLPFSYLSRLEPGNSWKSENSSVPFRKGRKNVENVKKFKKKVEHGKQKGGKKFSF